MFGLERKGPGVGAGDCEAEHGERRVAEGGGHVGHGYPSMLFFSLLMTRWIDAERERRRGFGRLRNPAFYSAPPPRAVGNQLASSTAPGRPWRRGLAWDGRTPALGCWRVVLLWGEGIHQGRSGQVGRALAWRLRPGTGDLGSDQDRWQLRHTLPIESRSLFLFRRL